MPVRAMNAPASRMAFQLGRRLQALPRWRCSACCAGMSCPGRDGPARLDDRMLKDIGITRGEAEREARRPFWSDGIDRPGGGIDPYRGSPAPRATEALDRDGPERRQTAALRAAPSPPR